MIFLATTWNWFWWWPNCLSDISIPPDNTLYHTTSIPQHIVPHNTHSILFWSGTGWGCQKFGQKRTNIIFLLELPNAARTSVMVVGSKLFKSNNMGIYWQIYKLTNLHNQRALICVLEIVCIWLNASLWSLWSSNTGTHITHSVYTLYSVHSTKPFNSKRNYAVYVSQNSLVGKSKFAVCSPLNTFPLLPMLSH